MNLVGNAVKFTERARSCSTWSTRARGKRDALRLAVRDTGPGIPAERMDRLFQPFSQADTSTHPDPRRHGPRSGDLPPLARALGG